MAGPSFLCRGCGAKPVFAANGLEQGSQGPPYHVLMYRDDTAHILCHRIDYLPAFSGDGTIGIRNLVGIYRVETED